MSTVEWDFGDGETETEPLGEFCTHTYASPGEYTVTGTVDGEVQFRYIVVMGQAPPALPQPEIGGAVLTVSSGDAPYGTSGGTRPFNVQTDSQDPEVWPTGPGVTATVDVLVDGAIPSILWLPNATYAASNPVAPADQSAFVDRGQSLSFGIGPMALTPGEHIISEVGKDSDGNSLWQMDAPYTVYDVHPEVRVSDGGPLYVGGNTDVYLVDYNLPDNSWDSSQGFYTVVLSDMAHLGAVKFDVTVDHPYYSRNPSGSVIPDANNNGWWSGLFFNFKWDTTSDGPNYPHGMVTFTVNALDASDTVVASYETTYNFP